MLRKVLAATATVLLGLTGVLVLATPAAADPLRVHAQARGKIIGNAVDTNEITDAQYRPVIASEFNQLTPGNAMKWDATEPNRGQFNFTRADEIVALAQANNQTVRGHTLVWHSQTPSWVQNLAAADLRTAMQNHITTLVDRYEGDLYAWDVVNEPLNEDGTLRSSFWYQRLGESYIADAFRMARAADPDVKLYINDYNTDGLGAKSDGDVPARAVAAGAGRADRRRGFPVATWRSSSGSRTRCSRTCSGSPISASTWRSPSWTCACSCRRMPRSSPPRPRTSATR